MDIYSLQEQSVLKINYIVASFSCKEKEFKIEL